MSEKRYGVYLLPPPEVRYVISNAHRLLRSEFNCVTAGQFMVHCTIKGFFKLREGATASQVEQALAAVVPQREAFTTDLKRPWFSSEGAGGRSVLLWMHKGSEFQALHDDVWRTVAPYVAPDCRFTLREVHGADFPPHVTLVQSDLSPEPLTLVQAGELCDYIYGLLPATRFEAQDIQLIEFTSSDWEGEWWHSLRFSRLMGWRLPLTGE